MEWGGRSFQVNKWLCKDPRVSKCWDPGRTADGYHSWRRGRKKHRTPTSEWGRWWAVPAASSLHFSPCGGVTQRPLFGCISPSKGGWSQAASQQPSIWPVLTQASPERTYPYIRMKRRSLTTNHTQAVSRFILKGACKCHHEEDTMENGEKYGRIINWQWIKGQLVPESCLFGNLDDSNSHQNWFCFSLVS